MSRLSAAVNLIANLISKASGGLGMLNAVFVGFIAFIVCADVIARLFGATILWRLEITEILDVAICWAGAAYLLREEGHIEVNAITSLLSQKAQYLLKIITSLVGIFISCLFAVSVWLRLQVSLATSEGSVMWGIPMAPLWILIFVGLALFVLQYLPRIYGCIIGLRGTQQ